VLSLPTTKDVFNKLDGEKVPAVKVPVISASPPTVKSSAIEASSVEIKCSALTVAEDVISPTTCACPLAVTSPVRNRFLNFLVAEPKSTSLVVVGVIAPSVKINCSVDPILKDIPVSATNSKCPSASELMYIAVSLIEFYY
tara:strand:+ start:206 stop:628 length:423 start_codon:yes stop_codon:yes gene_type:complete